MPGPDSHVAINCWPPLMSKVAPVIAARRDDQIRAFSASAPRCFEADA
jgi:hypothetical protein